MWQLSLFLPPSRGVSVPGCRVSLWQLACGVGVGSRGSSKADPRGPGGFGASRGCHDSLVFSLLMGKMKYIAPFLPPNETR